MANPDNGTDVPLSVEANKIESLSKLALTGDADASKALALEAYAVNARGTGYRNDLQNALNNDRQADSSLPQITLTDDHGLFIDNNLRHELLMTYPQEISIGTVVNDARTDAGNKQTATVNEQAAVPPVEPSPPDVASAPKTPSNQQNATASPGQPLPKNSGYS